MEIQTIEIINRVLPILFLLSLGFWMRRAAFISEEVVEGLRKIVVNVALPSVLFVSFLHVELKPSFLALAAFIFGLCVVLFIFGRFLGPRVQPQHPYFKFLMTGFEYGMLGVSLFGSAYGLAHIGTFAVVDLGHELFIWFVFLPLLLRERDGIQRLSELLRSFLSSPVVIAILLSLLFNVLGWAEALQRLPVTGAALSTLEFLASLTIPLILINVGYGIKLDRAGIGEASRPVLIRLAILLPLAFLINAVVIRNVLGLGHAYEVALFTLLVLPPPFIVPLFMRPELLDEQRYVNNVLTLYTLASIVLFTVHFVLNPAL
ncbi:MAG: AEC family transporter [Candidatus Promineifilaceae bacterium]